MHFGHRHRTALLGVALAGAHLLGTSTTHAQTYSPTACTWSGKSVPVYFNPGQLPANGYQAAAFRDALMNAMAVWNEESRADIDLYYAGDTSSTAPIPGGLLVHHVDQWACADNALAKAFTAASGDCRPGGGTVYVVLRDSCTNAARPWTTVWPTSPTGIHYESVMVHELGHAAMGLFDVSTTAGVMNGVYTRHAANLHLYPIDQDTAVAKDGLTVRRAATSTSTGGGAWSAPSILDRSSSPPSIGNNTSDAANPLRLATWAQQFESATVRKGKHASWVSYLPPPNALSNMVNGPVSIAGGKYGDVMVVFPTACTTTADCQIAFAWTNTAVGTSWTTGTLPGAATYTKVELAYDQYRDRFVAAWLDGSTGRIFTASTVADTPAWAWPTAASKASASVTETYRYMGGMVFNPGTGQGLFTAASSFGFGSPANATPGVLVQMGVNVTDGVYTFDWANFMDPAAPYSYVTRRHYGMTRSSSGKVLVGWRGTSSTRALTVASKVSMLPTTWFTEPIEGISGVVNSVDVGFEPENAKFVAGWSAP